MLLQIRKIVNRVPISCTLLAISFFFLLLPFTFYLSPVATNAAGLYLTPQQGEYQPGDSFGVEVRVDNQQECVNAMDVTVTFPGETLQALDVDRGDSILSLWVKDPEINQDAGTVSFIGGIPGGYCGRIAGDPGISNVLAKIIFQIPGFRIGTNIANSATMGFADNSQVLLNDGKGTRANLSFQGATFAIVDKGGANQNAWIEKIRQDGTLPESFTVELYRDAALFDNKYVIIFSTVDKQTGMDRFEVLEADSAGNIAGTFDKPAWKKAQSPYVLIDQGLHSLITVKAIDKAGNERSVEFTPLGYTPIAPKKKIDLTWWIVGMVGVCIALTMIVILRHRRKNQ